MMKQERIEKDLEICRRKISQLRKEIRGISDQRRRV